MKYVKTSTGSPKSRPDTGSGKTHKKMGDFFFPDKQSFLYQVL